MNNNNIDSLDINNSLNKAKNYLESYIINVEKYENGENDDERETLYEDEEDIHKDQKSYARMLYLGLKSRDYINNTIAKLNYEINTKVSGDVTITGGFRILNNNIKSKYSFNKKRWGITG